MSVEILQQKGYDFLWIDNELWMWNILAEVEIQKELADQASGDVLVVGYGLGVIHRFLKNNNKVKSITTIESNGEVLDECRKAALPVIGRIIIGNFFEDDLFPTYAPGKFDCIVGDIWAEIVPSSLPIYKKFKEKALEYLNDSGEILAWGKDYFEYLIQKEI